MFACYDYCLVGNLLSVFSIWQMGWNQKLLMQTDWTHLRGFVSAMVVYVFSPLAHCSTPIKKQHGSTYVFQVGSKKTRWLNQEKDETQYLTLHHFPKNTGECWADLAPWTQGPPVRSRQGRSMERGHGKVCITCMERQPEMWVARKVSKRGGWGSKYTALKLTVGTWK